MMNNFNFEKSLYLIVWVAIRGWNFQISTIKLFFYDEFFFRMIPNSWGSHTTEPDKRQLKWCIKLSRPQENPKRILKKFPAQANFLRILPGPSRGPLIKTLRFSHRLSNLVAWEPQKLSIIQKITRLSKFFDSKVSWYLLLISKFRLFTFPPLMKTSFVFSLGCIRFSLSECDILSLKNLIRSYRKYS